MPGGLIRPQSELMKHMGGAKGMLKGMNPHNKNQPVNPQQMAKMNQQLSKMVDPSVLKMAGGMSGMQKMMQQFAGGGAGGLSDMLGGLGNLAGGLGMGPPAGGRGGRSKR